MSRNAIRQLLTSFGFIQGDTKGSGRGEGSARKDAGGGHMNLSAQVPKPLT